MTPPDWMIVNAVRYATGRMTYVVGETADWLVNNWGDLPEHVRKQIRKDLERELDRDDAARGRGGDRLLDHHPLGHDCDRADWERVRVLWTGEAAG